MTTILFTGDALCADTKAALPTKPTRFVQGKRKLFKSRNGQFAYAFTGVVPPRFKGMIAEFEKVIHDLLTQLEFQFCVDRGALSSVYANWNRLSERERAWTFSSGMILMTRKQAYVITMSARAEFDSLGLSTVKMNGPVGDSVRDLIDTPWIYPTQGTPCGEGAGGAYALGVYAMTNDLEKTFLDTSLYDPLTGSAFEVITQESLSILAIG